MTTLHDMFGRSIPPSSAALAAMPRDIERGLTAGFDAYLTKPLDVKNLLSTLNSLLSPSQESLG